MTTLGYVLSIMLAFVGIFQVLLVLGLPFGEAAWGGRRGKVLPVRFRIASAVSIIFFVFSILVVLTKTGELSLFSTTFADGYLWFLATYLAIGVVMNLVSRSKKERLWAPYIALMFILCMAIIFS